MWKIIHLPSAQVMDKMVGNLTLSFDTEAEAQWAIHQLTWIQGADSVYMRWKGYRPYGGCYSAEIVLDPCEFDVFNQQ